MSGQKLRTREDLKKFSGWLKKYGLQLSGEMYGEAYDDLIDILCPPTRYEAEGIRTSAAQQIRDILDQMEDGAEAPETRLMARNVGLDPSIQSSINLVNRTYKECGLLRHDPGAPPKWIRERLTHEPGNA